MSPTSALMAVAALLVSSASAHIIMAQPVPYSNDKIDNSPITLAQFPCKSQNGFTVTKMNSMKVGEKQQVSFKGTAVHGGGSCQLSVTLDTNPTKDSKFKVVKSIEGGCPGDNGATKTYDFTLPDSIPNGKATFAWTWFSRQAGQPELYMNCAPIEVTGGASDKSKFDALPDTLFANVGLTTCKQVENKSIKFPNPGTDLVVGDNTAAPPTGQCGSSGPSNPSPASSGVAGGASSAPAAGGATSKPAAASSVAAASSAVAAPTSAVQSSGGVFAPSAAPTQTTLVTVTSVPDSSAVVPIGTGGTVAPSAAPSAAPTTAPNPGNGGSTCSQNGAVVCNGPTQFGLCNNGQVVWQAVAAGTTCNNGVIQKRQDFHRNLAGRVPRPRVVPGDVFAPESQ